MTTIAVGRGARAVRRHGFLAELDGAPALGAVGPNWFAPVMGTGIVAVALVGLPFAVPYAEPLAAAVWALATLLLVAVTAATLAHHRRHPVAARGHLDDPVMAHFYGAPAMALMTVGAGALLAGHRLIGTGPALALDVVLWTAGTALGLATLVLVPYRAFVVHGVRTDAAFGGWLMPVVPPMVSAATGALLVPHLPAGAGRAALLLACFVLFALALVASAVVIVLIGRRLLRHGPGAAAAVPTLWIVLGPLGQSVTAAHHLSGQTGSHVFALAYGVPVWAVAMAWLVLVATITARTVRTGLPFTLGWWSFTFPVGTLVTGTSGLAALTGLVVLQVAAGLIFTFLVGAWVTVLVRTLRGVYAGRLLRG